MAGFANVPLLGLVFLVTGFIGFAGMAIVLNDHTGLFMIIIGWYALAISCAGLALSRDFRKSRLFRSTHR